MVDPILLNRLFKSFNLNPSDEKQILTIDTFIRMHKLLLYKDASSRETTDFIMNFITGG